MSTPTSLLRADQLLSRFGYCSRREAPSWVKRGRVACSGEIVLDPRQRIDPTLTSVDGDPVEFPHGVLVAFHKPAGYVCSHEEGDSETIYDLLPNSWIGRIPTVTTVGRLDKDSSGLLLITDDGALVHRWSSPKKHVAKVYAVTCEQPIPADCADIFASGKLMLRSETEPCLPAEMQRLDEHHAVITLVEGRYHQVKRMFASQACTVTALHRTQIGRLVLGELPEGEWKIITASDVDGL